MSVLEMDDRNRLIGENVRKYRQLRGMRQDELAEGICSVSQLSKVENGKTYIKRTLLKEISQRLGVTLEQLERADAMRGELQELIFFARKLTVDGQYERSLEMVRDGIAKSRANGYWELVADGIILEAYLLLYIRREFTACIELVEAIFQQGVPLTNPQRVACYLYLGQAYQWDDNRVVAYNYYCMADDEFRENEEEQQGELLAFNLLNLSRSHCWMGNWHVALRYAEPVVTLSKDQGKHVMYIRGLGHKAYVLMENGEYEQAEQTFHMVLGEAHRNDKLYEAGIAHANYGLLLRKMERYVEAVHHFEQAIKHYDLRGESFHKCEALIYLAETAMLREEPDQAVRYVREMFELAGRIPHHTVNEEAQGHRILGQVAKVEGQFEQYVVHMETAMSLYGERHIGDEPYDVAVELAEAFYERGDERMIAMYRRAVGYARTTVEFVRQSK